MKMKRWLTVFLCLLLTLAMVLSMVGCAPETKRRRRNRDNDDDDDEQTSQNGEEGEIGHGTQIKLPGFDTDSEHDNVAAPDSGSLGDSLTASPDSGSSAVRPDNGSSAARPDSGSSAARPDSGSQGGGSQGGQNTATPDTDDGNYEPGDVVYDEFMYHMLDNGTWEVTGLTDRGGKTNLVLPKTFKGIAVTKTSVSAFQCTADAVTITIPGNIKIVGTSSFQCCDQLVTLIVEEGVETFGASIFQSCKKLQWVVLPTTLNDLGSSSFGACDKLSSIFYKGTEAQWKAKFGDAFYYLGQTTIYYYSASAPTAAGNYWHYVGGTPTVW